MQCTRCGSNRLVKKGVVSTGARRFKCKECGKNLYIFEKDYEPPASTTLSDENTKLLKKVIKYQDTIRYNKKVFVDATRLENSLLEYNKELISLLNKYSLTKHTTFHESISTNAAGILHITDTHFNELISLPFNTYDFTIAAKRCKKLVDQARKYFKLFNVKNILVAITGDILNSDKRLDKILNEATNRSKATFLAVQLLEYMLLDLNKDFNITVATVTGNESRIQDLMGWSDMLASDNYDFTIHNILSYLFRGSSGVTFLTGNSNEQVVCIGNKNILLLHGYQLINNLEQSIQKIIGKYAARDITIDFVIFGHLHSTRIGDFYARGSSMCGGNAYSDSALQLASRAAQNIHIVHDSNNIDSIKIDLQEVSEIVGYPIEKELEVYNAKSAELAKKAENIFKIHINNKM